MITPTIGQLSQLGSLCVVAVGGSQHFALTLDWLQELAKQSIDGNDSFGHWAIVPRIIVRRRCWRLPELT
jgi:hypothetical protein